MSNLHSLDAEMIRSRIEKHRWAALAFEQPDPRDPVIDRLTTLLDDDEAARLRTLTGNGAAAFAFSRGLLRVLIGTICSMPPEKLEFSYTAEGKPYLSTPDAGPEFNLSHCSTHLLIGVSSTQPIGVDVETASRYSDALAERFLLPVEREALLDLDPGERARGFCHLWTVKEACTKACGATLGPSLSQVSATLQPSGNAWGMRWDVFDVTSETTGAVAQPIAPGLDALDDGVLFHLEPHGLLASAGDSDTVDRDRGSSG